MLKGCIVYHMKEFDDLIEVADRLNSPGGCPWDHKQTFESLRPYVLEEAHEVLDAVEEGGDNELMEELGDLLYVIIFYAKVAEREKRFTLEQILDTVREKIIRRHPHVFGEKKVENIDEVISNWNAIKKQEKPGRTSALDGIPLNLPGLMRAQKMARRLKRAGYPTSITSAAASESLAQLLTAIEEMEGDIESELRTHLKQVERAFRAWEGCIE